MPAKTIAIVVTRNRCAMMLECADALLGQSAPLDAVLIVDNASTDGTVAALEQAGVLAHPSVHVIKLDSNRGCAGGFRAGVDWALDRGFEWLWMMDDDAIPDRLALEKMLPSTQIGGVAAVANIKLDLDGRPLEDHAGTFNYKGFPNHFAIPLPGQQIGPVVRDIDYSSFVGIMANAQACRAVGGPKAEMFLHHDDMEFCMRLRSWGRLLLVCDSIIVHKAFASTAPTAKPREVHRFGVHLQRPSIHTYARGYFVSRNATWLSSRYGQSRLVATLVRLLSVVRSTVVVTLFDDHKIARLQVVWGAFWDGLLGRFDNEVPLRVLRRAGVDA